jgi:hypothetical protein
VILINFGHPLTDEQRAQLDTLAGQPVERIVDVPTQFDHRHPFPDQVRALVDGLELSPAEWQTLPILVNPPALNAIAVTLLAELHGRMGHFPAIVRLRPVANSPVTRYEVAEIVNLQAVRDAARGRRK